MSGMEPRPWIKQLDVYEGGKSKAGNAAKVIKLSSNESALGASPKAMEAYRQAATTLHRYPDATYHDLRAGLSEKYDIEASRIVCGIGSDEILKLACRAYLAPGDEVIFPAHSFMMYPIAAKSVGAVPIEVEDTDYKANVDHILAAITERTRIIFLANPNNPTGTYLPHAEVERLWQAMPDNVLLVLDAAYGEFVEEKDYSAGIELVEKSKNVLMTRTFSKLYGLAALRIGWGYACKDIAETLDRLRDPFNVPSAAQVAAIAALKDTDFEEKARSHNNHWLQWIREEALALGLNPVPSVTNFVLIGFPEGKFSAEAANDYLLERGLILRWLPRHGLKDFLRLTVGLEQENREVMRLLKQFMEH